MKRRNGFVSNSSSTSFIAVCTKYNIQELLEKIEFKKRDVSEGMVYLENDIVILANDYQPSFYGMLIERQIREDRMLKNLKKEFKDIMKEKFGMDVPIDTIDLLYGEVSSG